MLALKAARARDEAIRLSDEGEHEAAQRLLAKTAGGVRASGQAAFAAEALELDAAHDLVAPVSYLADGLARKQLRVTRDAPQAASLEEGLPKRRLSRRLRLRFAKPS